MERNDYMLVEKRKNSKKKWYNFNVQSNIWQSKNAFRFIVYVSLLAQIEFQV